MEFQIRFLLEVNRFLVRFLQHHQKQQLLHQTLIITVMVNFRKHPKGLNLKNKEVSLIFYALQMKGNLHHHPKSQNGDKVLKDKIKIYTIHLLKITKEIQWRDKTFLSLLSAMEKMMLILLEKFHYNKIIIQEYRVQFQILETNNFRQNIQ